MMTPEEARKVLERSDYFHGYGPWGMRTEAGEYRCCPAMVLGGMRGVKFMPAEAAGYQDDPLYPPGSLVPELGQERLCAEVMEDIAELFSYRLIHEYLMGVERLGAGIVARVRRQRYGL